MSQRENPATVFIAHTLAERVHGPWASLPAFVRREWYERASDLVIDMYAAGFTIPQPEDPDAVWARLQAADDATVLDS